MHRLFADHEIRKQTELSSCLWDFCTAPQEGRESAALQVIVPSCWENYPETLNYRGKASYERDFYAGGNIRLEFKGVSHTAEVFLDGEKIAYHYNAYTPFSVLLTGLSRGWHHLKVGVDNSFGPDSALHVENDYQTYGGINRPVLLEELSDVVLTRLHVTPRQEEGQWTAEVEAAVRNLAGHSFCGELTLCVAGKNAGQAGEQTEEWTAVLPVKINGNKESRVQTRIPCPGASAWNPDNPVLYTVKAVLNEQGEPVDDLIDRFGFREIRISGHDILLNEQKLKIKGFCRHEDHPQFGCALPLAAMQQDLLLMRDMGANAVRTAHYPNDELFLDLCDEMGFLVWEENHARGLSEEQMRNPNFERQCEDCIREMIEAHYNHPSIYIWGILNECASFTEYGRECYRKQLDLIRQMDASRPRSFASCHFKTDICFDLPEVVSYNIYPLWYHDTPPGDYLDDLYRWVQEETGGAGKPFLITEVGAGAIYGCRTPAKVKWSEEYQAEALEAQLTAILGREDISGVYIWQFCDGRVCGNCFGGRPRTMNNKGIVDEYRRPKLAYEVVKRIFTRTQG